MAAALALVSLVCAALLGWYVVRGLIEDERGTQSQQSREQVMSVADQFVKRLGTYGPDMIDDSGQMPQYREQVAQVITDKFGADFSKQVQTVEQLVVQVGVQRSPQVFATGVSAIDEDSARVLIAGSFTDVYTKLKNGKKRGAIEQEPLPFRFTIDLVKVEEEWLVDDFSPVSSQDAGSQQPPAPGPSDGAQGNEQGNEQGGKKGNQQGKRQGSTSGNQQGKRQGSKAGNQQGASRGGSQ